MIPPELDEDPFREAFEIARIAQLSEAEAAGTLSFEWGVRCLADLVAERFEDPVGALALARRAVEATPSDPARLETCRRLAEQLDATDDLNFAIGSIVVTDGAGNSVTHADDNVEAIVGGDGTDTVDYSGFGAAATVDLGAGTGTVESTIKGINGYATLDAIATRIVAEEARSSG